MTGVPVAEPLASPDPCRIRSASPRENLHTMQDPLDDPDTSRHPIGTPGPWARVCTGRAVCEGPALARRGARAHRAPSARAPSLGSLSPCARVSARGDGALCARDADTAHDQPSSMASTSMAGGAVLGNSQRARVACLSAGCSGGGIGNKLPVACMNES
jgi:hypothetical protein